MREQSVGAVMVSKAPEDPAEKATWARSMVRVQIAFWVDGRAACAECRRPYLSVDDFLARGVKVGRGFKAGDVEDSFVDEACWPAYEARP